MTLMRKLLVGGTVLFVLAVAAGIYISQQSMEFKKHHVYIVEDFMSALTASWDLVAVESMLSDQFLEQAGTEHGVARLHQFSRLGPVQTISEIEMGQYFSGSGGTLGEFIFTAQFAPAKVRVKLTVLEQAGGLRVQGMTINSLDAEGRPIDFALAETD